MKFCDKLIALRKKSGMSQEDLAAKLNVSRQSVSKWESGNSYPETDKIIAIANLFNCSMDDLINENISNIDTIERKYKNNFNSSIDSFLEFITKSINMFCDMKFTDGFKCILEMIILGFILFCIGGILTAILTDVFVKIFSVVPENVYDMIRIFTGSILDILWFIISVIVIIHIFKIRYLDFYKPKNNTPVEETKENETSTKDNEKNNTPTSITNDSTHRPFEFLESFSKLIIWFIKFILFWFGCSAIFTLIGICAALVISISTTIFNTLFIGIDIILLSMIILNIIVLILIFDFIFNKKNNFKVFVVIALSSILLCGVGCGLTAFGVKDYTVITKMEDLNKNPNSLNTSFDENMIIYNEYYDDIEYIIDNNINDVKIEYNSNNDISKVDIDYYTDDTYDIYYLRYDRNVNINKLYKLIKKDLKDKTLRLYNFDIFKLKVYSNEQNINKILDNTKQIYNYNLKKTNKGFVISDIYYK